MSLIQTLCGRCAALIPKPLRVVLLGALSLHVMSATAWAQHRTETPGEDNGVYQWLAAIGLAIFICLPAFKDPKRSHKD